MNKNTVLKIVGALSLAAGSLVTAGILPAWVAIVATTVGTAVGALHPQIGVTK